MPPEPRELCRKFPRIRIIDPPVLFAQCQLCDRIGLAFTSFADGHRLFNFATTCYVIGFCLTVIAWLAAAALDRHAQFLSLSSNCHVSIGWWPNARLCVFNDGYYGPYEGSIIGAKGSPLNPQEWAFGDFAGIYFRLFRWPTGQLLWTLEVSLAYPSIACLPLTVLWIIRRSSRKRRGFPLDHQPQPE
jgi:hypothetical protein